MLLCSSDIYNWTSPAGLLRETKPLLAQVIGWNSGIHWFFRQNEPFLDLSGTFLNLIWLHTPMATPPKRWRWSKLHQVSSTLVAWSLQLPWSMLQVKVFVWRRNFLILRQVFNVQWDLTWQCIFHGHLQDTSQHPFTPPHLGLKMALQPAECADTLPK